jgi:Tfp pilus assembly protein PilN
VITKLNLATQPFRNRVLPYLLAGLLLVVSLIGGVFCVAKVRQDHRENELLATGLQEKQTEIARLKGEGEKVQQLLTPEQKAVLTASHKLVANKTFGWSRLFTDLENVLPGSVSASRVAVNNVFQDGGRIRAELELGVLSRDYGSVQAMLENMNNSGLFRAELRGQDLQQNERVTYTEYTFRVIYSPPNYTAAAVPTGDVAQNQTGGTQ